jgi:hypothetical protein
MSFYWHKRLHKGERITTIKPSFIFQIQYKIVLGKIGENIWPDCFIGFQFCKCEMVWFGMMYSYNYSIIASKDLSKKILKYKTSFFAVTQDNLL